MNGLVTFKKLFFIIAPALYYFATTVDLNILPDDVSVLSFSIESSHCVSSAVYHYVFTVYELTFKTLAPAVYYLEQNYKKNVTVDELSKLCYLSPSRFFYLFKQQTGTSPIVYKNKIACQRSAQDLLNDKTKPIAEIAKEHGFSSVVYFERVFKKIMGKSPSVYRKTQLAI